jgi:hypothetical protein
MNTDLQRELQKLERGALSTEQKAEKEIALRNRYEIDWGTIPGVDKPFLKQPGAEKFLFWLNLRPRFNKREIQMPGGHMEIVCSVTVYSKKTGEEVFEGPDCSCTTMESNYRFRFQERPEDEPQPTQAEARELKAAGKGRWKKFRKWVKGKQLPAAFYWFDRVDNPNIYDEYNKVRQIGQKRALVKAVRNMGALSEIFVADPSEWDIPDDDEGSPEIDAMYSEGGRRIVNVEAEQNWERREKEGMDKLTKEQLEIVERKTKATPPNEQREAVSDRTASLSTNDRTTGAYPSTVTATWKDAHVVHLSGDGLGQALLNFKSADLFMTWLEEKAVWAMVGDAVPQAREICNKLNIGFTEIALQVSSEAKERPLAPGRDGGGAEAEQHRTTPYSAPPAEIINGAEERVTSKRKIPVLSVNVSGAWVSCWDKKLWEFLKLAKGKECELIYQTKDDKKSIVGIKRIGTRTFTDGYVPDIQMGEDRPTTTGELFQQ